jgi:predicted RNA binding protein YcfA (HicA-like mRNA interferase family)
LVDGYYSAVTKILRDQSFHYVTHAKGSHEKWMNREGRVLILPRKLMSRHTANSILKDAGSAVKI